MAISKKVKSLDEYFVDALNSVTTDTVDLLFEDVYKIWDNTITKLNKVKGMLNPQESEALIKYLNETNPKNESEIPLSIKIAADFYFCTESTDKMIFIYFDYENNHFSNKYGKHMLILGNIKVGFGRNIGDTSTTKITKAICDYLYIDHSDKQLAILKNVIKAQIKRNINNAYRNYLIRGLPNYIYNQYLLNNHNPFYHEHLDVDLIGVDTMIDLALMRLNGTDTAKDAVRSNVLNYIDQFFYKNENNNDCYNSELFQKVLKEFIDNNNSFNQLLRHFHRYIAQVWIRTKSFAIHPNFILNKMGVREILKFIPDETHNEFLENFYSTLSNEAKESIIYAYIDKFTNLELNKSICPISPTSPSLFFEFLSIKDINSLIESCEFSINDCNSSTMFKEHRKCSDFGINVGEINISPLVNTNYQNIKSSVLTNKYQINLPKVLILNINLSKLDYKNIGCVGVYRILSLLNQDKEFLAVLNKVEYIVYLEYASDFIDEFTSTSCENLPLELRDLALKIKSKLIKVQSYGITVDYQNQQKCLSRNTYAYFRSYDVIDLTNLD